MPASACSIIIGRRGRRSFYYRSQDQRKQVRQLDGQGVLAYPTRGGVSAALKQSVVDLQGVHAYPGFGGVSAALGFPMRAYKSYES